MLEGTPVAATEISVDAVSSVSLYEFDPEQPGRGPSGELIAGVLQRFEGTLCGTALFALDPGDALLWLQRGDDDGAPLDRFVSWGSRLLDAVIGSLANAAQTQVKCSAPVLEERPLMAVLLGTHAPSDTVVLSLHGTLSFPVANVPEILAPFSVQVLLEPKILAGIGTALGQSEAAADA